MSDSRVEKCVHHDMCRTGLDGSDPALVQWCRNSSDLQGILLICDGRGHQNGPMYIKLTKIRGHLQKQGAINENEGADELLFGVLDQN